ncbi:hypothetical protein LTR36_010917 [Oleoguttula mirabilis]|uniref:Glycosyltransferase family 34 protein n=1 Tax=Oleoguttula mirabilis TaxID=1507867 RepID=A0AAV9J459_9PEZI|nr:hypothetical protein LTR36_010917 [Oleoguttula mirabilis]
MASWTSPCGTYRDTSPTLPLTPLSPGALPQWLRSKSPRSGILSNIRLKTVCVVLVCLLLGWMVTSTLGPSDELTLGFDGESYDAASGGVMSDPSGFGLQLDEEREGIIGTGDGHGRYGDDDDAIEKEPSVSGALSELHHAVSDKLQSWNPYRVGSSSQLHSGSRVDSTAGTKGRKKPANATAEASMGEAIMEGIKEEDRLGARTRIGKCTILFNGNSFWERAIRTHEQHDKIHGYRLHVLRQSLLDDVWSKPAYILSLLLRELGKPESDRLEWLFWVDADTIILNPYIPIETFLPPPGSEFDDVHLMYSNDWNGLNNGVFPVRVNQWSVQLFSAIVAFRYYRPEDPLVFRDQSAMNTLMQEPKFARNIVNAPQRWFNAYQGEHNETLQPYQIRRGDLLVHFAGVPNREERMGYWLDRAEQHLDDWEIPVKSTSYPQEGKDFWAAERDARKNHNANLAETRLKATTLLGKTDQRLNEYADRLTTEQLVYINQQKEALKKVVEDEKWQEDVSKVTAASKELETASEPLTSAISSAHKLLLNAAHEAIFAGEKDLFDGGFDSGVSDPDLQKISETVKKLKNLVMSPQDFWDRNDITVATNAVTEARATVQEKASAAQEAAAQVGQEQVERAKALEEARKMVQAEADHADQLAAGDGVLPAALLNQVVTVTPQAAAVSIAVATVTGVVLTVTPEPVIVWTTATVVQEHATHQTATAE